LSSLPVIITETLTFTVKIFNFCNKNWNCTFLPGHF
jgi:hypothetical protein